MKAVLVTNLSGSPVELEDLGYVVAAGATDLDLRSEGFTAAELRKSESLQTALTAATPLLSATDDQGNPVLDVEDILADVDIEFRDLVDTPSSYVSHGRALLRIASTEDQVEVVDEPIRTKSTIVDEDDNAAAVTGPQADHLSIRSYRIEELLFRILQELEMMNLQLSSMTDFEYDPEDLERNVIR